MATAFHRSLTSTEYHQRRLLKLDGARRRMNKTHPRWLKGGAMTATAERVAGRDLVTAERAAAEFLTALGIDMTSPELAETPGRMARAYAEMLTPGDFRLTTF